MKTIKGDLVKLAKLGEFDIIVHGCNCFCSMGAGIALQIANEFRSDNGHSPESADDRTSVGDFNKLGTMSTGFYDRPDGSYLVIVNGYTQYDMAIRGERAVDYNAVRSVFNHVGRLIRGMDNPASIRIGYPAIGAGLAGGDWNIISEIIDEELDGLNHTYVEYSG